MTVRNDIIRWSVACLTVAAATLVGDPVVGPVQGVHAAPMDLTFTKFFDPDREAKERTDSKAYGSLMSEVSLAMGPRMVGPAASLGALGIEAAYELSFVGINSSNDYWIDSVASPEPTLTTGQLRVRKGMPYGIQLGGSLTHMTDSNLWAIGAEFNMSLVDGFVNVPDVAVRASVETVLGNADLSMLIVGADLVASKSFGIAGLLALQPWAGYSFVFTHVQTHQIDVYVGDTAIEPEKMLLKELQHFSHRAAFGLRVVVTRVSIGGEFMRSFTDDLNVISAKIGVDF